MNTPTHDEIALHAQHLWQDRGCPNGIDTETWLEAERQLGGDRQVDTFTERAKAETAAESVVEYHISPAVPEQEAIQAALQKQGATAPQVSRHPAPRAKPPETGKPAGKKPHSS